MRSFACVRVSAPLVHRRSNFQGSYARSAGLAVLKRPSTKACRQKICIDPVYPTLSTSLQLLGSRVVLAGARLL